MVSNVADRAELLRRIEKAETQVQLYISPSVHFNVCVCVCSVQGDGDQSDEASGRVGREEEERKES